MIELLAQGTQIAPVEVAVKEAALYIVLSAFVILIIAVLYYLRTRDQRDDRRSEAVTKAVQQISERHDETVTKLGESCHVTQQEISRTTAAALDRNTAAMKENTTALAVNSELVRDVRRIIHENIPRPKEGT